MIISTILKRISLSGVLITVCSSVVIGSANASVTYEIVTGNSFVGQTSGPSATATEPADIYWEGPGRDAPVASFFPGVTTGLNTIGSTAIFLSYDNLQNLNFQFQSFGLGNTVYANSFALGDNLVESVFRQTEIVSIGDGVTGTTQSLVGSNFVAFNANNTYSYSDFTTEDENFNYSSTSFNAYTIFAGQDPSAIFTSDDPSIYESPFTPVDRERLVDHFNYLATQVDSDWTALSFEIFQTIATAKDSTMFTDFEGLGFFSYVSYDAAASPVPLPAALPLFISALFGYGFFSRRMSKKA